MLDFVREPQKKAEEQLEKINKEIEFYNLSKKSRLQSIEGVNVQNNGEVIIDAY